VLNRPTSKSYNDSPQTPTVSYFYDGQSLPSGAPSYDRGSSTGRLVAVTYGGASAGTYRGYDAMGRVIRQYQQTDSVNYLVEASYYANSSLQNETYPSVPGAGDRRVVSYTNDSAGRLASLNSNATTYAPAASVSSIGYASHNALNTETYGNSLIHAVTYNNRLQANEIKLGTSGAPTSVIDLTYSYGTTNNNGNLQSITYTGGGLSYTQSFGYDALNRLTTSNENSGSSWSQTNGYDQYGNRWIDYGGGIHNLSFSTSTNRITTSGFTYDSSGNLTNDGAHAYSFDAENKINRVDNASAYVYDGEGQRLRKLLGENLRFVYDMHGKQIAEFDGSTGNLKKEYIYGSSLITIEPTAVNSNGTQYLTSDHLGSPRVVTNSSAGVVSRHDYLPFGEELGATIGGRTTGMGYSVADGLRQKFTQKERDNETGLDYFGARYYGNTQGRFTGADPAGIKQKHLMNPQDLNRYTYVANNPLAFIDPNGAEKIRIIIRTFIPVKSVSIPGISTKDPTLPLPMRREFGGDDRTVGEHPERFRTQQIITLETDPTKNRGCASPLCLSSETKPGKTRELLAGGREKTGAADVSGMSARAVYPDAKSSDMIVVTATGHAHDPLVEEAPDLHYDVDVGLSYGKDGKLYASVYGTKSEFPGIEVFVQRPEGSDKSEQLIQGYNPQDQGRGIWYILGTDKIEGGRLLKQ